MAYYKDITIDQGSTASINVHLTNKNGTAKNLTNYTASSHISPNYNLDSSSITVFNCTVDSAASGIINLSLTHLQTNLLKANKRYVYDLEIARDSSGSTVEVERVLEGQLYVTPSVTKLSIT
jgi:hypothetical protein